MDDELDTEQFLKKLGYEIAVRTHGWTECLVAGHGERWVGRGVHRTGAVEDAARQMFPSHAAVMGRAVLGRPLPVPEPCAAVPAVPAADDEPPRPNLSRGPLEEDSLAEDGPAHKTVDAADVVSADSGVLKRRPGAYVDPELKAEPPEPQVTKEEALEIVAAIDNEVTDNLEDVAVMASASQRLHIGAWIFRGRVIEEDFREDEDIKEAVHQVALRLTALCKVYWPGSVRALQIYSTPLQALDGLVRTKKTPTRWAESAEITDAHMERVASRSGYDEYGWRDAEQCSPAPPDPDKVLLEAVQTIEAVVGPLGGPLDDKSRAVSGSGIVQEMEALVAAAHLLRWVRCSSRQRDLWGKAMGALRWASRQPRERSDMQPLQDIISEEYRPAKSWAELLGRDPTVNRKVRLQKQVMERVPAPDWLEEDLLSWLHQAFQVLANPQIAKLAENARVQILELTNADFSDADRSTRTRLRKLQSMFRTESEVLPPVELPDVSSVDEDGDQREDAEEPEPDSNIDPALVLLGQVQEITEGKRVLFVTNRDDVRLQKDLERDLKCTVTLRDGGSKRQMKAILASVSADRYDLVLMATGFNSHVADTSLCRAAKTEKIPYVRVQKGRVATTIRALGRVFNLSPERKPDDEATVAHTG